MKLLYEDITYKVREALFNVYNSLGYGHKEEVYQNALKKEFSDLSIPFEKEVYLPVFYKDEPVGNYRADFVIDKKIIIELKAVPFMPKSYENQLINYLKSTGYLLGLLINFGSHTLIIKRLVWTNPRESTLNQRKSFT